MKTNPNENISPVDFSYNFHPDDPCKNNNNTHGLTKREYFAALAMQGFCQGAYTESWDEKECAKHAVLMADALIEELNKE